MIVQLPAPISVMVFPDTLHWPLAMNVTGKPDEAVALTLNGGAPTVLFGSAAKLIVWFCLAGLLTAKLRATSGAALYVALPAWCAVIVQLPAPVSVTIVPLTLHFPLAVNVTGKPDEVLALTLKAGSPTVLSGSAAKLIV